jgi:hypothetical protein
MSPNSANPVAGYGGGHEAEQSNAQSRYLPVPVDPDDVVIGLSVGLTVEDVTFVQFRPVRPEQ